MKLELLSKFQQNWLTQKRQGLMFDTKFAAEAARRLLVKHLPQGHGVNGYHKCKVIEQINGGSNSGSAGMIIEWLILIGKVEAQKEVN